MQKQKEQPGKPRMRMTYYRLHDDQQPNSSKPMVEEDLFFRGQPVQPWGFV